MPSALSRLSSYGPIENLKCEISDRGEVALGQCVLDLDELSLGVIANRSDGRDTDHNDQRHHDGIFDCRWTVFADQKLLDTLNRSHVSSPSVG